MATGRKINNNNNIGRHDKLQTQMKYYRFEWQPAQECAVPPSHCLLLPWRKDREREKTQNKLVTEHASPESLAKQSHPNLLESLKHSFSVLLWFSHWYAAGVFFFFILCDFLWVFFFVCVVVVVVFFFGLFSSAWFGSFVCSRFCREARSHPHKSLIESSNNTMNYKKIPPKQRSRRMAWPAVQYMNNPSGLSRNNALTF